VKSFTGRDCALKSSWAGTTCCELRHKHPWARPWLVDPTGRCVSRAGWAGDPSNVPAG